MGGAGKPALDFRKQPVTGLSAKDLRQNELGHVTVPRGNSAREYQSPTSALIAP